jgi:hypothetical protein
VRRELLDVRLGRAIWAWPLSATLAVGSIVLWVVAALWTIAAGLEVVSGNLVGGLGEAAAALILCGFAVLAYRSARSPSTFSGIRLLGALILWMVAAWLAAFSWLTWPRCYTVAPFGRGPHSVCSPDVPWALGSATFALIFVGLGLLALRAHRAPLRHARVSGGAD